MSPDTLRAQLTGRARGGGSWFFWVAGLSVASSLASWLGHDWGLVFGSGASTVFHELSRAAALDGGAAASWIIAFSIVADLFAAGVLAAVGVFARRRIKLAFLAGMALYAADGVICLYAHELLGAVFHFFALAGMYVGYDALRRLDRMDDDSAEVVAAVA